MNNKKRLRTFTGLILSCILSLGAVSVYSKPHTAQALTGYNQDRILDDSVLYNVSYNTDGDIQNFLNNTGAPCSTSVCLRNFNENNKSTASILAAAANANGINALTLIALIEAETGLVTNTAPTATVFANAFGQPSVSGFTNQANKAAAELSITARNNSGIYKSGTTSTIPLSPNPSCGTSQVTIANNASAAIYSYFKYAPNTAALSANSESGDACSSYGVRNFFNNFSQWFGPSVVGAPRNDLRYVCRFGGMPGDTHFWTADMNECSSMKSAGYRYEGLGWRVPVGITPTPVYRLYNPVIRRHLYTLDAWEVHVLSSSAGWRAEGIAWYATNDPRGVPVYRLYNPRTYEHFYTTDSYEVYVLTVQNHIFNSEGIAWRQPVQYQ